MTNAAKSTPDDLIEGVLSGDFRSIARLISLVENDSRLAIPCLQRLFRRAGRAFTIGITGAPGSGKSTLVDQLAAQFRKEGKRVGVIAVDPTSPFTGGAILGDRIRMQSRDPDPGIFIRSMATRGHLGGLTRTAADVLTVLDAAGFDIILVETVGVGQDEVEIARTTDMTLVLLVPGMGDDIQAMKAGLMEIGDVFVINKADHAGVERIESELRALLSMNSRQDQWDPAIVRTVASEGDGLDSCMQAISAFREFQVQSGFHKQKDIQIRKERLLEWTQARIMRQLTDDPQIAKKIDELALQIAQGKTDPFSASDELLSARRSSRPAEEECLVRELDHIGIAVRSLEESLRIYERNFGLKADWIDEVAEQKTRVASLQLGKLRIELLEAAGHDSPVGRFISKRGEGIHHLCFRVDNILRQLKRLKAEGMRLIDETPKSGAGGCLIAFIHPSSTCGVLIELLQQGNNIEKTETE